MSNTIDRHISDSSFFTPGALEIEVFQGFKNRSNRDAIEYVKDQFIDAIVYKNHKKDLKEVCESCLKVLDETFEG